MSIPEIMKVNYEARITKAKLWVNIWNRRDLTLMGKVTIIKSLIYSQFSYLVILLKTFKAESPSNYSLVFTCYQIANKRFKLCHLDDKYYTNCWNMKTHISRINSNNLMV